MRNCCRRISASSNDKGGNAWSFLGREKPYSKSTADLARDDQLFLQLLRRIGRRNIYYRNLGRQPSLDGNRQFRQRHIPWYLPVGLRGLTTYLLQLVAAGYGP
jgi:hypothetical protein